jgi:hypothetical protein
VDPAGVRWHVGNCLLKAVLICLAAIVWIVLGIGKVLMYSVAALLFVAISLVELVAMPIVLLLRLLGAARWPVQINRQASISPPGMRTTSPRPRCCATR